MTSTIPQTSPPNNWPNETWRAKWAKILGVPLSLLLYAESRGRLIGRKDGWNTVYTKEEIWRWWLNR